MDVGMMDNGWTVAVPMLQALGLILAFLAGGVLAMVIAGRKGAGIAGLPPTVPLPAPKVPPVAAAEPGHLLFGHEMKNYLCAIKGNARLLRLGAESREQAAIIDRIDRVVERLETFAWKGQAGAPDVVQPDRRETVDLLEAARSCVRTHFLPSAADFTVTASGGLPHVQGDPHRLEQVLMNLYGNALEAGARKVATRIRRIGAEVEIAIEDDGRGCAQDQAARIFQPFYSTKADGKGEGRGIRGLGLFIVRSIVDNHGGRIRVSARNGRGDGETGLVVYLHFPLSNPRTAPAPARLLPIGRRGRFQVESKA